MTVLAQQVAARIETFSGTAGVHAQRLDAPDMLDLRGGERFPAASILKVFVLLALFQEVDAGTLELDDRQQVASADKTRGSGVLTHLSPGLSLSLHDLATLMVMVSDNTAANMLIDRLGLARINAIAQTLGFSESAFHNRIDFDALAGDPYKLAVSTPTELSQLFARLYRGELLSIAGSEMVLSMLRIQKYVEPLRRHLPADPYAREFAEPEPVWVASKTGSLTGVRCEAGVVVAGKRCWSIAVMTRDSADRRVSSEHEGVRLIAEVSELVYRAWS